MIKEIINNILVTNLSLKDYATVTKYISELEEINTQLQYNWNNLKEDVKLKEKPKVFGAKNGKTLELAIELVFNIILDKMNELEKEKK